MALLGVGERRALLAAGVGALLVWPTATVADALGMAMGAVPRAVAVIARIVCCRMGSCRRGRMRWRGS